MENSQEQMIINLMQNLVDSTEKISDDIQSRDEKIQLLISENYKAQTDKIVENLKLNAKLYQEKSIESNEILFEKLEHQKPTSSINNHKHYSLFGEKSTLKTKQIILILFGLIFIWGFLRYIPEYYIEHSQLKKDKEDYQLFYEYIFFNQFENQESVNANQILKDIQKRDSLIMKRYGDLKSQYKKENKILELVKQIDSLSR